MNAISDRDLDEMADRLRAEEKERGTLRDRLIVLAIYNLMGWLGHGEQSMTISGEQLERYITRVQGL